MHSGTSSRRRGGGGTRSNGGRGQTYQIDFTAVASGKRIASSKRRVRWYVTTTSLLYSLANNAFGARRPLHYNALWKEIIIK